MDPKIKTIKFKGQHRHLKAGWDSIRVVVGQQIPQTGADYAFLHSLMTDIAKVADSVKDLEEEERESVMLPISMPVTKGVALWHCCNIILQNEMAPNKGVQANIMELMAIVAPKIDAIQEEPTRKLLTEAK